ncbi:MAG: zinc-ribbon domain-containing protein, partial [Ruminiclostridium sp.]
MFCTNCGHQLSDDAKFCNNCGAKLEEPAGETVVPQYTDKTEIIPQPAEPAAPVEPAAPAA